MPQTPLLGSSYPRNPGNNNSRNLVPSELRARPQWLPWRYGPRRADGKRAKEPVDPRTGRKAVYTDPATWTSFEHANVEADAHDLGLGFVFSEEDPYTGLDFDGCRDPETGEVHPAVLEIMERLGNPHTEVSPSGTGLKCFVRAEKLPHMNRCKTTQTPWGGALEVYDRRRYFTVTANTFISGPISEAQDALEELYGEFFPSTKPEPAASSTGSGRLEQDRTSSSVTLADDEVIELCRRFYGAEFEAPYYHGDISRWASHSDADYWLLRKFAWVSGKDPEQMERIFSGSALGSRAKWTRRSGYRLDTIEATIRDTRSVYDPASQQPRETRARDQIRENLAYALFAHPWRDITGDARAAASDYFGYRGVLRMAHKANSLELDISVRDYQQGAALGNIETAAKSLNRLVDNHGVLVRVADGSAVGSAARYRLKPVAIVEHTQIAGLPLKDLAPNTPRGYSCVPEMRPLKKSWLIPHPSPVMPDYDRNGRKIPQAHDDPMRSLGKVSAWVADIAHATHRLTGKPVPPRYLAERTGMREKHLKHRHAKDLTSAGLLEEVEGGYLPPENIEEAVSRELAATDALRKFNATRKRIRKQRQCHWAERLIRFGFSSEEIVTLTELTDDEVEAVRKKADHAPTTEEMREHRALRNPDGLIKNLQREARPWGTFVASTEEQAPIGFEYAPEPQERPETAPKSRPSRAPAPEPPEEAVEEEPCHHSAFGYTFPGGRGCYVCDPNHEYRRKEREPEGVPA